MEKITDLKTYVELASNTLVDLGDHEKNVHHLNLGLLTEKGEFLDPFKKTLAYGKDLDIVNVGEELADYCWYLSAALHFSGKKDSFSSTFSQIVNLIDKRLAKDKEFNEAKTLFKDKPYVVALNLHKELEGKVTDLSSIYTFCKVIDIDFWQILTNNNEKLKVRFPNKFSQERALNRDLDTERNKLEKK